MKISHFPGMDKFRCQFGLRDDDYFPENHGRRISFCPMPRGFIDWNALPSSFFLARCIYYCPLNFPWYWCCQSLQFCGGVTIPLFSGVQVIFAVSVSRVCCSSPYFVSSVSKILFLTYLHVTCCVWSVLWHRACGLRSSRLWWGHGDV